MLRMYVNPPVLPSVLQSKMGKVATCKEVIWGKDKVRQVRYRRGDGEGSIIHKSSGLGVGAGLRSTSHRSSLNSFAPPYPGWPSQLRLPGKTFGAQRFFTVPYVAEFYTQHLSRFVTQQRELNDKICCIGQRTEL